MLSWSLFTTIASFILVAGGLYTINDILDKDVDIHNVEKTSRPITSGKISTKTGSILAGTCISLGLAASYSVNVSIFSIVLLYVLLVGAYSIELKKLPWLETAIVSAGFVLRMLAGGQAVNAPVTIGFLIVSFFGASLIVLGKRYSELVHASASHLPSRASLNGYSLRSLSAGMYFSLFTATSTYAYMALIEYSDDRTSSVLLLLSSVAMTLAGIVLVKESFTGKAESLDKLLTVHRPLATLVTIWAVLFVVASYVGAN